MRNFDLDDFSGSFNNAKGVFAVIHFNDGKEKEAFDLLKKRSFEFLRNGKLALIIHDKDKEKDGTPKTPHIHVMFESLEGHSKQTWIGLFADALNVKREAVGVRALGSIRGALRYLVHVDFPDRYQYPREEAFCSEPELFDLALAPLSKEPSYDELMACNSRKEIYEMVGLTKFAKASKARDELMLELRKHEFLEAEFDALLDDLAAFVADPRYAGTGIPQTELQKVLTSTSDKFKVALGKIYPEYREVKK